MIDRRIFVASLLAAALPLPALAQAEAPNADMIYRKLEAAPSRQITIEERVGIPELKRRRDLRVLAPSIDIQAINFEFDSAQVPLGEYPKVEEIAIALRRVLRRSRDELILIEGHTDAPGSRSYNQRLSEQRARFLRRVLINEFGVPGRALETVGYGEDLLLVPTYDREWRNRRVTLRRITDFVRY